MIEWLLQSIAAQPDLARGIPPGGLLNVAEQDRFAGLKTAKRRCDWLLGRWTAKRLVQAHVEQRTGLCLPLDMFAIKAEPSGAPYVIAEGSSPIADETLQSTIGNLQLSISHSGDRAFCALAAQGTVGADIERVEPRAGQFAEDYFTAGEIAQVQRVGAEARDTVITAIWSAKEAALKALKLGLTVDTRGVECWLGDTPVDNWCTIAFTFDAERIGRETPALLGWWRRVDDYVLTVAAAPDK